MAHTSSETILTDLGDPFDTVSRKQVNLVQYQHIA